MCYYCLSTMLSENCCWEYLEAVAHLLQLDLQCSWGSKAILNDNHFSPPRSTCKLQATSNYHSHFRCLRGTLMGEKSPGGEIIYFRRVCCAMIPPKSSEVIEPSLRCCRGLVLPRFKKAIKGRDKRATLPEGISVCGILCVWSRILGI